MFSTGVGRLPILVVMGVGCGGGVGWLAQNLHF